MWEADGTPHDIGVDASHESYAVAINNGGLVIGTAVNHTSDGSRLAAFVYDSHTGDVSHLPGGTAAQGINDARDIVGRACLGTVCSAAMWTAGSQQLVPLSGLGGRQSTSAEDINNAGQIVGEGRGPFDRGVSLYWPSASQPPVKTPLAEYSYLPAINDRGEVVGAGPHRAVLWDAATNEITWLGPADELRYSGASDINEHSIAVGRADTGEPPIDSQAAPPAHAVVFGRPE